MTHFTGICTFPHGSFISGGLLLAACAALIATTYSVASCRLVVLSFASETGNFEQSFSRFDPIQTESLRQFKVALGLFQWMRPVEDVNWDEGVCVGYQQSMLESFSEKYFDIGRSAGSISVLLGVMVVLWSVVNSCVAWNMWQIIMLASILLAGTVASSLSFIFLKSDICNTVFPQSSCTMDEGGLVLIAGTILWLSAFLITVIFMRTLDSRVDDYGLSELERARAREMAQLKEKRAREKERLQRRQAEAQQRRLAQLSPVPPMEEGQGHPVVTPATEQSHSFDEDAEQPRRRSRSSSSRREPPKVTVVEQDEDQDEYEVYINTRQRRIDEILRDIQDSEERHLSDQDNQRRRTTSERVRNRSHEPDNRYGMTQEQRRRTTSDRHRTREYEREHRDRYQPSRNSSEERSEI